MSDDIDWIALAGKRAKGKRPEFFGEDFATDRILSILMAVVGEVSVLRQRLDTVERLLEERGTISQADIEAYAPDAGTAQERGVATKAYIARVMRGVQQAVEAMQVTEKPIETLSKELKEQ